MTTIGRTMLVEARPLEDGYILGLREQFGTAEMNGAKISLSHGFGFGIGMISIEIDLPDGRQITETIKIHPMLETWAEEILTEQGVMV